METLKNISSEQASKRISDGRNTIWEILDHVIQWRMNVLGRVKGEVITSPGHNYFLPVKDTSPAAWKKTIAQLKATQNDWISFLKKCDEKELEKKYEENQMTYYEHIHGILQHDAYHLGQVVLLSKLL